MSPGRNQPPEKNACSVFSGRFQYMLADTGLRTTISPTAPGFRRTPCSLTTAISKKGDTGLPTLVRRAGFSAASMQVRRVAGAPCSVEPKPWHQTELEFWWCVPAIPEWQKRPPTAVTDV